MNRVARIRTDPGLSNSQLADDPILERSTPHQPPWDPRGACMHLCVCGYVCLYKHVDIRLCLMCVCIYLCGSVIECVCVHVYGGAGGGEGGAIRNQTEAACASCPPFEGRL